MNSLNVSNHNHKLFGNVFPHMEKWCYSDRLTPGADYIITLDRIPAGEARLIEARPFKLSFITESMAQLTRGISKKEILLQIEQEYGDEITADTLMGCYLFRWDKIYMDTMKKLFIDEFESMMEKLQG